MAQSLNLTGYVKNLPDGSVYLEAQGVRESVVTFIDWCRTGPRNAFVDSVEYSLHPAGELKIFQIR
jgi:acylphosphatase